MGFATIILLILKFSILLSFPSACTCAQNLQPFFKCIQNYSSSGSSPARSNIMDRLYTPDSPAYTAIMKASSQNQRWLSSTSHRPFLIISPRTEPEIRPVILCAKSSGHQIRVNSGGHDYEGLSSRSETTPFIMLELSNLNSAAVDIDQESAWIQTGVQLGQLYYEISKKSGVHAFPAGLYPTVGAGGHISGGGIGTLMRKHGLAADNVLDARIMDVNGQILDRKSMGEDLFWALRGGGGGSFGVILAWKLRLVRVPGIVTAFSVRKWVEPGNWRLIQKWQSIAHNVSDDLFVRILLTAQQVKYEGLFLGPATELVPLLKKTFPEFDLNIRDCSSQSGYSKECYQVSWIKSVLYFCGKSLNDPPETLARKTVNTDVFNKGASDFLKDSISDKGWDMIHGMLLSGDSPMMILDPLGGKLDEISENETPFPHRKGNLYNIQYLTYWKWNSDDVVGKHVKWIRDFRGKMEPYVARSPRTAYINYKDLDLGKNDANCSYDQAKVWGEKYFKGNFERLAKVKGQVDPGNFFRNEQSIPVRF